MPWQQLGKWHVKQRRHEAITLTGGRVRRSRPAVLAEQGSFQQVNPGSFTRYRLLLLLPGAKTTEKATTPSYWGAVGISPHACVLIAGLSLVPFQKTSKKRQMEPKRACFFR